jgi:small-conductance mechanosensitive channel
LELEYERLREEEAEIDHFERNRLRQLEDEVAYYEREIRERSRDIDELNTLFRAKLQERQQVQAQSQFQPQMGHFPQGYFKTGVNDDTSISSIPPNN